MSHSRNIKKMLENGLDALKKNKNEKALAIFEDVIQLEPENTMAWNNKGVALRKLGRLEDAINCYNKVLVIEPKQTQALINKARALKLQNKLDLALFTYEDILEINPNHQNAFDESNEIKAIISQKSHLTTDTGTTQSENKLFRERTNELVEFLNESMKSISDNTERIHEIYQKGIKDEALELRDNILSALDDFNEQLQDRIKRIAAEFTEIQFIEENQEIIDNWIKFRNEKVENLKKLA
jgi:tetratricopeptide (TPR) repeat protein